MSLYFSTDRQHCWGLVRSQLEHFPAKWLLVRCCREMVQGLHRLGLRVVLDVVYNHTFHSLADGTHSHFWL